MPNNSLLYNAALAGGVTGLSSRANISPVALNYNFLTLAAAVFAEKLDESIPPEPGGASAAQGRIVESLTSAFWYDRIPISLDQDDYEQESEALAAIYQSIKVLLLPESQGTNGPNYATQVNWYFSSSGDDTADGATPATALRTRAEYTRRVGLATVSVSSVLHQLDDASSSDPLLFREC